MKITYIHREAIDTEKWNDVIAQSPAETIFLYTWYLDTVAANWSALVVDDYRFIMPVVWKKKAGLKYVYQPFYTQQLGVFSKEYVDPLIIKEAVEMDVSAEELVKLKKANDVIQRSEKDYARLQSLLETLIARGAGTIYAIRTFRKVIASAFFAHSRIRAIYLVSASGRTGKEPRSMFRIVDAFIRKYAGSGIILDFEGSNIPSGARFFGGFGAHPEIYQGISFSRLPATLNKLR